MNSNHKLKLGQTIHSTSKVPVPCNNGSSSSIGPNSEVESEKKGIISDRINSLISYYKRAPKDFQLSKNNHFRAVFEFPISSYRSRKPGWFHLYGWSSRRASGLPRYSNRRYLYISHHKPTNLAAASGTCKNVFCCWPCYSTRLSRWSQQLSPRIFAHSYTIWDATTHFRGHVWMHFYVAEESWSKK